MGAGVDHVLAASAALNLAPQFPCRTDGRRIVDSIFGHPAALYKFAKLSSGQNWEFKSFETAIADLENIGDVSGSPRAIIRLRARENRFCQQKYPARRMAKLCRSSTRRSSANGR